MIKELVAVHEDNVTPLTGIESLDEPRSCGARNLTSRDNIDMIEEYLAVRIRIEDQPAAQ